MHLKLSTLIKILAGALLFISIAIFSTLFTIFFIPSAQEEVEVPDVIGKDFETAYDILISHKLRIKKVSRFSDEVPVGYVFSQNPSPGKRVRSGRQVEIIVGRGKADIVIPDVKGLTVAAAKDALSHMGDPLGKGGLRVGYLAYAHCTTVKENVVMAQSPLPMSRVSRGTEVNLLISLGPWPRSFEMPKLRGMELEDALERMRELSLVINQIREVHEEKWPEEVVIEQSPPDGYRVKTGDLVNLVVSKGEFQGLEEVRFELIRFMVPKGFYNRQVQIVVTDYHGEREIYINQETPGRVLEIPVRIVGEAQVLIYVDGELAEEGRL